jgi:hypothetical protein
MKIIKLTGILLSLVFLTGCWAPKSVLTTANITQPVLVGKVKTINGEKSETTKNEGTKFSAAIVNSIFVWSAAYAYGHTTVTEGSNVIDEQLLPLIDEVSQDKKTVLVVDQIRYDAMSGYWLFVLSSANKGWIDGYIY